MSSGNDHGDILAYFVLGTFTAAITGVFFIRTNRENEKRIKKEVRHNIETEECTENCNVISVFDGKISIDKDQIAKNEYKNLDYKLAMQDEEELVIYVYSENKSERQLYTSYIVSKIHVNEDGSYYFDEYDLSEADYNEFADSKSSDQYSGRQRTRNNEEN